MSRFILLPHAWQEEDQKIYSTDLRLSPFCIEAYHAGILDYIEDGIPMSRDITVVLTKSGGTYNVLYSIQDFEKGLESFYKQ